MTDPMDTTPKTWRPQEVQNKVIETVRQELTSSDDTPVGDETSYERDLVSDSIDMFDLVINLNGIFEIEIPDDEATRLTTVGDTIRWITAELKKRTSSPHSAPLRAGFPFNLMRI